MILGANDVLDSSYALSMNAGWHLSQGLGHVNVVQRVHHRHGALQRELRRQLGEVHQRVDIHRLLAENLARIDHLVVESNDGDTRFLIALHIIRQKESDIHERVLNRSSASVLWQKGGMHVDSTVLEAGNDVRRNEIAKGGHNAEVELLIGDSLWRLPLSQCVLPIDHIEE